MVREVRIVSDEELAIRARVHGDMAGYAFMLALAAGVAMALNHWVVVPFIGWLEETGLPAWWLYPLELVNNIPMYFFDNSVMPRFYGWSWMSQWWKDFSVLVAKGLFILSVIAYPIIFYAALAITPFLAIIAVALWGWVVVVVILVLALIAQVISEIKKQ